MQTKFERLEAEVKELTANKDTLRHNLLDLIELQHILINAQYFFADVSFDVAVLHPAYYIY